VKLKMTSREKLLKTLTPATEKVYNYLLNHNPQNLSLTQISRDLHLSKSTVRYHLDKLKMADLIEETQNGYKVKKTLKISILKYYAFLIFGKPISFHTVTASVFSLLLGAILTLNLPLDAKIILGFLATAGLIISLSEVFRQVRKGSL